MDRVPGTTPLTAIDAVVLDTETTDLDVRKARLLQVGAVRITGGTLAVDQRFERLIDPGIPIPPRSTAVHGISDAGVRGAPGSAAVLSALEAYLGAAPVIGHSIAYDRSVLDGEAKRAGLALRPRLWLDVRTLAEIARPGLAHYDLDRLVEVFGIEIQGRHTAIGDATATAELFLALAPLLRERDVRTLAEADAACRSLIERQVAAGRAPSLAELPPTEALPVLARIDSFTYTHRIRDVMSAPPVWCAAERSIHEAAGLLIEQKLSSALVQMPGGVVGIVTERDLLRALHRAEAAATVGSIASRPLHSVADDDFVYRAIGRMDRLGIRHLGVSGADGVIVGVVTTRNLLRHRASTAIVLGDAIDHGTSVPELARAWGSLAAAARSLHGDRVEARDIAAVISSEVCSLTARAFQLAEAEMAAAGKGAPPVPYAVLVLGSAGRGESLLAADQDNAIVTAEGEPGCTADRWFEAMATRANAILDEVGVPLCKGGVMAKTAAWRHSAAGWHAVTDRWVRAQRPDDVLSADIFLDGVAVHGETRLADAVLGRVLEAAHRSITFQKQLTEITRTWSAPMTFLGNLRTGDGGRIDLKKHALMPIFGSARVLAIRAGVQGRSTPERLRAFAAKTGAAAQSIETLIAAHGLIMGEMLEQQLADGAAGVPLSPRVDLKRLDTGRRKRLTEAVRNVAIAIELVGEGRL